MSLDCWNSAFPARRRLLDGHQRRLDGLLIFPDQFGKIVGNRNVQLVDWTSTEVGAGFGQFLKLVQLVQPEEILVDIWIGQIVSRNVSQRRESLVDVIVAWILDDVVGDLFLVAEQRLMVVVSSQIAIDHFCMVTYANLKDGNNL